jgi:hypothetical protein
MRQQAKLKTLPATQAGQSCAIDPSLLANDPNIDAAENTRVSVARTGQQQCHRSSKQIRERRPLRGTSHQAQRR